MKRADAPIAKRDCSDRRGPFGTRVPGPPDVDHTAVHTCYSDMLQGMIAGHYTADEAHIGLLPMCPSLGGKIGEVRAAKRWPLPTFMDKSFSRFQ
jgi:hypothetical protein